MPSSLQDDDEFSLWLSPQVRNRAEGDISDDIYSIGQLLFVCLTGREWRDGETFESTSRISDEVKALVTSMLHPSPWERPRYVSQVREALGRLLKGEDSSRLEPLNTFTRATPDQSVRSEAHAPTGHRPPRERQVVPASFVYAGLGLLILLAVGVFFLAPRETTPEPVSSGTVPPLPIASPSEGPVASSSKAAPMTPLEAARLKQYEEDGARIATELLRVQLHLEDAGVHLWAQERYDVAVQKTGDADAAYREDRFEEALAIYQQSLAELTALRDSISDVKASHLERGAQALNALDSAGAVKALTIAAAIDPADSEIKAQLDRALNLDEVLAYINEGEMLLNDGKLLEAREKFVSAQALDPEFAIVADSLREVDRRIAEKNFADAMTNALAALANEEFNTARQQFERAQKILPNSSEPRDGLQQVETAILDKQISTLKEAAENQVANESWQEAADTFNRILALDSTLLFASQGLALAQERIALDEGLVHFLQNTALLAEDDQLNEAKRVLVTAARAKPRGDRLQQQVDQLSQFISLARVPVSVQLNSDNLTDVTVYKVGNLGRLSSTSLELIPGNYRIVGKRRGYRDVEVELTLHGGRQIDPIFISCTERI